MRKRRPFPRRNRLSPIQFMDARHRMFPLLGASGLFFTASHMKVSRITGIIAALSSLF